MEEPPKPHHPKVSFKVLNFFLRGAKKTSQIVPLQRSLTPEEIQRIFRRAYIKLRAIYRLNQLTQEIIKYGTSSNLFDLSTRDRPALQRYLFPLNKMIQNDGQIQEFPVIHPNSVIKQVWNVVFTLLMIYTATLLPFRISFFLDQDDANWYLVDIIIDVLFYLDLFINLFSGYIDEEGKIILNRKQVIIVYLKGWFTFDFIACFPLSYILDATVDSSTNTTGQNLKLIKLVKLPRLYRLFRMARVIKLMKYIGKSEVLDFFKFNYGVSRLFQLFVSVCLIVHISGCIWHYVAAFNDYDSQTWIFRNDLVDSSSQTKYIASIYYAFYTLTTVGYGEIHAKSSAEMIITIILMIVGVCFYSLTIGLLSSVLSQIDQKAHKLTKKKAIMNEFCIEKKISKNLRDKLKETLEYNFSKNCFMWADNTNIFKDLPINLRYEIMMNIHAGVFGNMQLFQLIDDKAFLVRVVPLLKPLLMMEKEMLWEKKSNPDALYFLADGRVNFKTEFVVLELTNQKKQFAFKSMIGGSYFGDIEIFKHIAREHDAQCESKCEMYYLTLTQFECEIYDDFPHVMERMKKIALDRHAKNEETIKQLQLFIKDATEQKETKRKDRKKQTVLLRDFAEKHERKNLRKIKISPFNPNNHVPSPTVIVEEHSHPHQSKLQDLVKLVQEIDQLLD